MAIINEITVKVHDNHISEASVKGSSIYAFSFPRKKRNDPLIKETLSQKIGVYMLIGRGKRPSAKLEAFFGHGNVAKSLSHHHSKKMIDKSNNWFETVVIYDSKGEMTDENAHAIEAYLIRYSRGNTRWRTSYKKGVSEDINSEEQYVRDTIDKAVVLTRVLGWDLFQDFQLDHSKEKRSVTGRAVFFRRQGKIFTFEVKNISARMLLSEAGSFVVLKGSQANKDTTGSTKEQIKLLRKELIQRKVLRLDGNNLVFAENQNFSSVSTAGSVIAGYGVRGPKVWILPDGTTYGDWLKKNKNR